MVPPGRPGDMANLCHSLLLSLVARESHDTAGGPRLVPVSHHDLFSPMVKPWQCQWQIFVGCSGSMLV